MTRIICNSFKQWRLLFVAVVLATLLSAAVGPAHAAAVGVGIQFGQFSIPGQPNNLAPGYQTAASGTLSGRRDYAQGSTTSFAAHGALTVAAQYSSPDTTTLATHYGEAYAYFADTVTIDAPGLAGQQGSLEFSFVLDGPLVAVNPSTPTDQIISVHYGWGSDPGDGSIPSMNGFFDSNAMRSWNGWSFGDWGRFVGIKQTKTLTFTFGQPFDFWVNMKARFAVRADEPGQVGTVFSLTKWSGFKAISAGGAAVGNATVASASGTDWLKPVDNHYVNPPVRFTMQGATAAKITWPTNNIGGFVLESASSLAAADWAAATNAVNVEDANLAAEIQVSPGSRFYRLRRP